MAIGKNKRLSKSNGKKGAKKNTADKFAKKDWYQIIAPYPFQNRRNVGVTLISRQGTKGYYSESTGSFALKHRIFEVSLADLQGDEDLSHMKIKLRVNSLLDIEGKVVKTRFWGMDCTADKLRSLVRKGQTLIEAHVVVKTIDDHVLRLFCIGFTKKRANQQKRTCYAQSSQIKQIRQKMREIMVNQAQCSMRDLVWKFIHESIGRVIEKATSSIYPLENVFIRKAKMLEAPHPRLLVFEAAYEEYGMLYGPTYSEEPTFEVRWIESSEDLGVKMERPAEEP